MPLNVFLEKNDRQSNVVAVGIQSGGYEQGKLSYFEVQLMLILVPGKDRR